MNNCKLFQTSPIILLIISGLIINNKVVSEESKLSECKRCNILTDSFKHWLDKTSRGKYEGGDAAWEEAKLKSYSRSEIRLVEVQEALCSEVKRHKDECYALAEEAEQPLEKWWFNEDPQTSDLHTWLCIDTLQYCCPPKHFGVSCSPCPLDKNNKVCGGNGKCAGDGTRKGNGTCLCKRGYIGNLCLECSKNFFESSGTCEQCHRACDGCTGYGPGACIKCTKGWKLDSEECVDIDECADSSVCKANEYCQNIEGSFSCKACDISCKTCKGSGPSNCTSCEVDSILWLDQCMDENKRNELMMIALKKVAMYCGLFIITLFIFKHSKSLASLVVLVIAVFIYFSELSSHLNLANIVKTKS